MTNLPCTIMTRIRVIATAAIRRATSRAMKMGNLIIKDTTSMDTRPLATMSNSMMTMTMICGETGAGVLTRFLSLSHPAILLSRFPAAHGNTHTFCRFLMFLEHVHSGRILLLSCITYILLNVFP